GICHNGRAVSKQQTALFKYPKVTGSTDFGVAFSHPAHLKPRPSAAPNRASLNNPLLNVSVLGGNTPRCDDCHKPNETAGRDTAGQGIPELNSATGGPSRFVCHGGQPPARPGVSGCGGGHKMGGARHCRDYRTVRECTSPGP